MKLRTASINYILLRIVFWPMILLTLIIMTVGSYFVAKSINEQVNDGMMNVGDAVLASLESIYPGEYWGENKEDGLYFYKGDHEFNWDFEYIDAIKEKTGCDITICYNHYAVITTLMKEDGTRLVGNKEDESIFDRISNGEKNIFIDNAFFDGKEYYVYYCPLANGDKQIGMLSVAKEIGVTKRLVRKAIFPIIMISLFSIILASIFVLLYSKKLIGDIRSIQKYMKDISQEDFHSELDYKVVKREDELGEMARSSVAMSKSLRRKVEEDLLTGLYNRRSADKRIKRTIVNYADKGVKFCLAIGDIDFFKKVNDTYGHEAGDDVLRAVAYTLKNFMIGKGYAIRWGGEEFILVFEDRNLEKSVEESQKLLEEIRALLIVNGDNEIKVTMTLGMIEARYEELEAIPRKNDSDNDSELREMALKVKMDYYIGEADKKLYYGKEHGRNQLVYNIPEEKSESEDMMDEAVVEEERINGDISERVISSTSVLN